MITLPRCSLLFKTTFNATFGSEDYSSRGAGAEVYGLKAEVNSTPRGLQPRSFEVMWQASASGAPYTTSSHQTNMGLLANMIWSSQLTNNVVITSYDINNSFFQWLAVGYADSELVTAVSDEVYVPTVPTGTRLLVYGLRTTTSASQNVKFSLKNTDTKSEPAGSVSTGNWNAGVGAQPVRADGVYSQWSLELGYNYATPQETLDAYQEWATNPGNPSMEWPATTIRLSADGFVFEPSRQLATYARSQVEILGCQPDLVGFYHPLESTGSYGMLTSGRYELTTNAKLSSFIEQDPVSGLSSVSDAHPFNLLNVVYGTDIKQSKPVVFGSTFNDSGIPYNYFVSGFAAQRSDRTDSTSAYAKLADADSVSDIGLGWMLSPNQVLYWTASTRGFHLSGAPISNAVGVNGDLIRVVPLLPQQGVDVNESVKFGLKVDSNQGQGLSNVIDFETSSVNGKLIIRAIGELDSVIAIGAGLTIDLLSGYVVPSGRTLKFGSVGWTN